MITRLPGGRSIAAITAVLSLAVLLAAGPVSANTTSADPAAILMGGASVLLTVANTISATEQVPNYWLGAFGCAVGVGTLLMSARDPDMTPGLAITGGLAITSGFMAVWYRRTLNHVDHPVALAPGWQSDSHGGHIVVTLTHDF